MNRNHRSPVQSLTQVRREEMLWRTVENDPKYCNAVIF